ncbi:MAG: response regulator transcription factor [Pseudomonadota bacterium]
MLGRIAVVDDDPKVRALIRRCLEPEGYGVDEAADEAGLFALLGERPYALITLDLNLPGRNGLDIARRIRSDSMTPIIMVTGKGDLIDRVVGLEVGADDYLAKPFHVRELLARVKAVLRRVEADAAAAAAISEQPTEDGWQVGEIRIFPLRRAALDADGAEIRFTSGEFNILMALTEAAGRALTRDTLTDAAHGRPMITIDRTVDNTVARMRKRLPPGFIKTVRSVGYQLGVPAARAKLSWPSQNVTPGD